MPRGYQLSRKHWKPLDLAEGYHANFDGATLANGDVCTGQILREGALHFYLCRDAKGNEYETEETPCIRLDCTNAVFVTIVREQ
jgi:hypothetical protein